MARKIRNPGRRARRKGHQFEREVAIALRPIFPKARRHLEYQDGECFGVDIAESGAFKIQCKKLKNYAPLNTIFEIQCEPELGDIPVLITAADGKPTLAALPFADLMRILKALKDA